MVTSTGFPGKKKTARIRFVLLQPTSRSLAHFRRLPATICHNRVEIEKTLKNSSSNTIWISWSKKTADDVLRVLSQIPKGPSPGHFVALRAPDPSSIPALQSFFHALVGVGADFQFLPDEELVEVLSAPSDETCDLFIGGRVDLARHILVLIRGNLQQVVIPLSSFWPNRVCKPDPTRFRLTDYGGTICLGNYEASNHAILYEVDPDYRRRIRAKRRAKGRTFGASLARLRRLKALSRDDFAPISSKEIARIERDEIDRPHAKTIATIAARLGVSPEEIETY